MKKMCTCIYEGAYHFFFWMLYLFILLVKIFKYIIHGIPDILFFVQNCMQVQLSETIIVLLTLDIQGSSV